MDPKNMDPMKTADLVSVFAEAIKRFYEDPENMRCFNLWKAEKEKEAKGC